MNQTTNKNWIFSFFLDIIILRSSDLWGFYHGRLFHLQQVSGISLSKSVFQVHISLLTQVFFLLCAEGCDNTFIFFGTATCIFFNARVLQQKWYHFGSHQMFMQLTRIQQRWRNTGPILRANWQHFLYLCFVSTPVGKKAPHSPLLTSPLPQWDWGGGKVD